MFEWSTVFLNIHWFCDKTGMTGSTLQWVNGIILIIAFFFARLCYGSYKMLEFICIRDLTSYWILSSI
jgi:hypothetical protein